MQSKNLCACTTFILSAILTNSNLACARNDGIVAQRRAIVTNGEYDTINLSKRQMARPPDEYETSTSSSFHQTGIVPNFWVESFIEEVENSISTSESGSFLAEVS